MARVKTDAEILALFDRVAAEVKKAGAGSRKARALSPAFHADQNEWSDLEMSNLVAAELEERAKWRLTGAVLLRGEQRCMCGNVQQNTHGVYARAVHRNGCITIRRPLPEDYAMLEALERHIEWLPVECVTNCAVCFDWGERRLQQSFAFESQGEVPPALQELADMTVMELYGPRPVQPQHNYFKEHRDANAISESRDEAADAVGEDADDVVDTVEAFRSHTAPE